jgi:hypothetical protein
MSRLRFVLASLVLVACKGGSSAPAPAAGSGSGVRMELAPIAAGSGSGSAQVERVSMVAAEAVARQGVQLMGELADQVGGQPGCAALAAVVTRFAAEHRDGLIALKALAEQLTDAQKQAIETEFDKPMTDRVGRIVEDLTPCQDDAAVKAAMDKLDL